jgi:hypothetical protein
MKRLAKGLKRLWRSEDGSIAIESMLMMPILIWCYLGVFVFFDAYRAQSVNIKAAYTIGDMLSRETGYITPAYLDSMYVLQQFLVDSVMNVDLRITVYRYQLSDNTYRVRWSFGRGGPTALNDAELATFRSILPNMPNNEIAILTETWVEYDPAFDVGLSTFTFEDKVVTRPRFAPQLCYNTLNNGTNTTAVC